MSSPEGSTVVFRHIPAGVRPLALRRFARRLQRELCGGRSFVCLIAPDAELRRLNRDFRGQDYPTDVLSFPVAHPSASDALGDIAISHQRASAQAREFGHPPETEIRILMLHGVLHLLGMDHESDGGRMARAEKRWRARLHLPNGLIERVRA